MLVGFVTWLGKQVKGLRATCWMYMYHGLNWFYDDDDGGLPWLDGSGVPASRQVTK
jgi:hypothetical protein